MHFIGLTTYLTTSTALFRFCGTPWAKALDYAARSTLVYFALASMTGWAEGPWDSCDDVGKAIHERMDDAWSREIEARARLDERRFGVDLDELVKATTVGAAGGATTGTREGALIGGVAGAASRIASECYDYVRDTYNDIRELREAHAEGQRLQEALNEHTRRISQ